MQIQVRDEEDRIMDEMYNNQDENQDQNDQRKSPYDSVKPCDKVVDLCKHNFSSILLPERITAFLLRTPSALFLGFFEETLLSLRIRLISVRL